MNSSEGMKNYQPAQPYISPYDIPEGFQQQPAPNQYFPQHGSLQPSSEAPNPIYQAPSAKRSQFKTEKARMVKREQIIVRHLEILNQDERNEIQKWTSLMLASSLFLVIVQIPLTLKYYFLIRQDPILNRHLLKRVYLFPLLCFPTFWISNRSLSKTTERLGGKYLGQMTDDELIQFEALYEERKKHLLMLTSDQSGTITNVRNQF